MFMKKSNPKNNQSHVVFLTFASFLVCVVVFSYVCSEYGLAGFSYLSVSAYLGSFRPLGPTNSDPCTGKYIFVHQLPRKFNSHLLHRCQTLSYHMKDMCVYLQNSGFGPPLFENASGDGVFRAGSWFATDQFTLEVIFHSRMKQYKCLTNDSSSADALFVPFYAALEAGRNLEGQSIAVRDKVPTELLNYMSSQKEWKVMEGRDHFLVAGRIAWDFRRSMDNDSFWGNKFMNLPQAEHIKMLTIESTTYHENEAAIPYPTYFHPSSADEIRQWQKVVAREKREYLFSFAGAPRPWQKSIRGEVISQCLAAPSECILISCKDMTDKKCHSPLSVLKLFRSSNFCLQPPGDSPTRRSTFDSIISGCIPVFFDLKSGPEQYTWYFPSNYTNYSVYIPHEDVKANKTDIRKVLSRIPAADVKAMRSQVIKMIPRVIYTNRRRGSEDIEKDAFDIAVEGILNRVAAIKTEFRRGKKSDSHL
uniref:Exostosin GT47 domain-containing protein n=1 Tax=Kalanchoe fedtschenkoi TaxID=63787 RepID=A0A7N0TFE9_KALFE